MHIDHARCRKHLDSFELEVLFIERLGWDRHKASLSVLTPAGDFSLHGFAEKRGFAAFICEPDAKGRIPDHQTRAAIEREITKAAREHIIIYTDKKKTEQVWQWVRRGKDQPIKRREFGWRVGQTSGILLERVLPTISFSLAEEENLTLPDVTTRATAAFDIEKVTKRFYERFQAEHGAFHAFIKGIKDVADRDWYASVMLNRLMFCYFIQKKGLLDGDQDYLRNRLARLQQSKGKDKFWSFYRHFLTRLFHEGLGQKPGQRKKQLDTLIGHIPYLNGGLFDIHELEATYKDIQISDEAFERLFTFFDEYRWHLDERPLRENNEINPDVLGYIFEKYINQKQMGAYYTKEDITGYISQNTVLPFILDHAAKNCAIAFKPDSSASIWRLLKENPDAYIYEPVLRGVIDEQEEVIPLPTEIAAGIDDVAKRTGWNKRAPEPFALPTETWREHVARRQRCLELRRKLAAGEVTTVNDLVTLNLDIRQFVEDVIDRCEGPELIRAFWRCLVGHVPAQSNEKHEPGISILDPTCGSGAFLFAALNILEPLYEACLDRMESFVEDLDRAKAAGEKVDSRKYSDFKRTLAEVADHPNQRYFILKSIIVNNLYGVDIMAEACEICKLRLFLKLVAQVEEGAGGIDKIEPLPDIDFNIRAGNTLVGFTSLDAVKKSMEGRLDFGKDIDRIETQAEQAAAAFRLFREMQTDKGVDQKDLIEGKRLVRERLRALDDELNLYLAAEYGVDPDKPRKYKAWLYSHQPFHWLVDFYGIMSRGGFDVIIGNPPYLEVNKLKAYAIHGFRTQKCRDIYAWVVERTSDLLADTGCLGLIIPVSMASSKSFKPLREVVLDGKPTLWLSHFANRPGQLFNGAQNRLTILLRAPGREQQVYSTRYHRWDARGGERDSLFSQIEYANVSAFMSQFHGLVPKVGSDVQLALLNKLNGTRTIAHSTTKSSKHKVFWVRVPGYFCQFFLSPPMARPEGGGEPRVRGELNDVAFPTADLSRVAYVVLNSSTYYGFFTAFTDGRHINPSDVKDAPFDLQALRESEGKELKRLSQSLERSMRRATTEWRKSGLLIESVDSASCVDVLASIDEVLGRALKLPPLVVDALVNHDAKFRLRVDDNE
jgi:Eco57I restriction-modification methylase